MTDLQVFKFNDAEVRTIELNGEIWFIAKDVCDILELGNVTMSLERLSDKQKLTSTVLMSGQNREVNSYPAEAWNAIYGVNIEGIF